MSGNELLRVEHLTKTFGKLTVLNDISTSFAAHEVVSVIGPSGGGKSTFLRCLNLLEQPSSGHILFDSPVPPVIIRAVLIPMEISQKILSMHDQYCIDIYRPEEEKTVVAILVTLQHMMRDRAAASSSYSSSSN